MTAVIATAQRIRFGLLAVAALFAFFTSPDSPSGKLFPIAHAEDGGTLYNTAVDIRMGNRYFERQCSRCHGFDAKGNDETGAPDLTGRLRRASRVGIRPRPGPSLDTQIPTRHRTETFPTPPGLVR